MLQIPRPSRGTLPFFCQLTFIASGDVYGNLVQLSIEKFNLGRSVQFINKIILQENRIFFQYTPYIFPIYSVQSNNWFNISSHMYALYGNRCFGYVDITNFGYVEVLQTNRQFSNYFENLFTLGNLHSCITIVSPFRQSDKSIKLYSRVNITSI